MMGTASIGLSTRSDARASAARHSSQNNVDDLAIVASLIAFEVAFAIYRRDAWCFHASSRALELLGSDEPNNPSWSQVSRLVAGLLSAPEAANETITRVPGLLGTFEIAVHRVCRSVSQIGAIVIFHPTLSRADGAFDLGAAGLTIREQQVAQLIAESHGTKAIAAALGISCHTTRRHTERVFAKLGVCTRTAVARIFTEAGILRSRRAVG